MRCMVMLNLDHFQQLFDIEDTGERCQKVLEVIEPTMQKVMNSFISNHPDILNNNEAYEVKSYAVTLKTTMYYAVNPKSAESKKDSTIGRKYMIYLQRKIKDDIVNILTIEFNGMEKQWRIYSETRFNPIWKSYTDNKISELVHSLPSTINIYRSDIPPTIIEIDKKEMNTDIKINLDRKKRPSYSFGRSFPLNGMMSEEEFIHIMDNTFIQLQPIHEFLITEKKESVKADYLMKQLMDSVTQFEISLFGNTYKLNFDKAEQIRKNSKTQVFHIYDQDQLIVKGKLDFHEFHDKISATQRIGVDIYNINNIFTPIRQLISKGEIEWWIAKSFKTRNKEENQLLTSHAIELIGQHDIEVKQNSYKIGTYSNDLNSFTEDIETIKKRLITAALIFSHVQDKIELPEKDKEETIESEEVLLDELFDSNFELEAIYDLIQSSKLSFSKNVIRDFHLNLTALEEKHFVILSGISGTGKTQLAKLYANAVYGLDYESNNPYLSIIPVRPDWMDGSPLFGYYSSFEKQYVVPEFLKMVLQATKEREKPHFIMLDEMNLAKVEYYLSDYLSAVESQKEIPLHNREDIIDVPNKILIPPNVYIIGTINVDETTHSISDKVLDRAFVMNLSEVDFEPFWNDMKNNLPAEIEEAFLFFKSVHNVLEKYDLHFGYRTMNEMIRKLVRNNELPESFSMELHEAMDVVIVEKVLPKIRGDERIESLFEELIDKVRIIGSDTRTEKELVRMKKELDRYGATQYWR